MKLNNLASLFKTNIRISELHQSSKDAVWPSNIDLTICRIPIRKKDGWDPKEFSNFAKKLKNHTAKNGVVFLICYAPTEAKARPFEVANLMTEVGFTHVDNILIEKTWFPGKRSETTLVNSHEYVLHFCNGNIWKLDRTPIHKYLGIQNELSCPGNSWRIETGSLDEAYPEVLADLLIKMANILPNSVIFDPYMSNTSSLKVALKLSHSFYGFDTDKNQHKKYEKIIKEFNEGKTTSSTEKPKKGVK